MQVMQGFDRPDKESVFLTFVAQEFRRRGSERRKELASKECAADIVARLGLRSAKKYKVLQDIRELRAFHLKKRIVLKFANGWSARGVMLLERMGRDRYFDYMSLSIFSLEQIKAHQQKVAESFPGKQPLWMLEEFLEPAQTFGAIPFDYKCYVFGQQIGLIVQVDRNSSPPRLAFFDGAFQPLVEQQDYVISSVNAQRGVPIIPPHAAQIQWWAMKLSRLTDAPFVSVDMYDTPTGPVFGEFTFSPGGVHKRMFQFSHQKLDDFDALFVAAEKHLQTNWQGNGEYPDTPQTRYLTELGTYGVSDLAALPSISPDIYRVCSGVAHNLGGRGADRISEHYAALAKKSAAPLQALVSSRLAKGWAGIKKQLS